MIDMYSIQIIKLIFLAQLNSKEELKDMIWRKMQHHQLSQNNSSNYCTETIKKMLQ